MYRVICTTHEKEYDLLNFNDEDFIIYNAKLTMEINKAGSFEFMITGDHPSYGAIYPVITVVKVYQDEQWLFSGRVCDQRKDFYKVKTVYCEGILSYLCDSRVRPYSWNGTTEGYLRKLITEHNSHVNPDRQFKIGQVISTDSQLQAENNSYLTTMEELQENLISGKGLHVEAMETGKELSINCTKEILYENTQGILFGENILDLEEQISGTELKTVMIGIGGADKKGNVISVEVENQDGIQTFGRIEGKKDFPDITDAEKIKQLAKKELNSVWELSRTVEIKAVDLNMIETETERLRLGYVNVMSEPHGLQGRMILSKITKFLTEPEKDSFVLGWEGKFYTERVINELSGQKRNGASTDLQAMTKEELEEILV